MNSLVFNTTTPVCTVALSTSQGVGTLASDKLFQHGEKLLGFVDELLQSHQLALADLDVLGVVHGPGSFVGTRLGCAVASAIAFTSDVPVVLISTLQALAQSAYKQTNSKELAVIQDARMQQVYFAEYQLNENGIMCLVNEQSLLSLSDLTLTKFNSPVLVGDAVDLWQQQYPDQSCLCLSNIEIDVSALISLVELHRQQGNTVSALEIIPRYS